MFGQSDNHVGDDSDSSMPFGAIPSQPTDPGTPDLPLPADITTPLAAPSPVIGTAADPIGGDSDDLVTIKQEALQALSPLVSHLDQTPEEKFRTTMMMIQATDDKTLVRAAYEAANHIIDEKARAQALLDVVNEINYFTQQK